MTERQINIETQLRVGNFHSKDDENLAKDFLAKKGLDARRYSKAEMGNGPTPDFKVYDEFSNLVFYCEVKSIVEDDWLNRQLDQAPPLTIVGGARNDSAYNNVSNKIHEAVAQFDAVNYDLMVPNVLIFVNHQKRGCDRLDLYSVLTGYLPTSRGKIPYNTHIASGRIKYEKNRIHLCVWLEGDKAQHFHFGSQDQDKKEFLYKLFKLEQEMCREI